MLQLELLAAAVQLVAVLAAADTECVAGEVAQGPPVVPFAGADSVLP